MFGVRNLFAAIAVAGALILSSIPTQAQTHGPVIPDSMSFQGRLNKPSGAALDTTVAIRFILYDRNDTSLWVENHPSVDVVGGQFNVTLGKFNGLEQIGFDEPLRIGIKVGSNSEMSPLTPLRAAPYALGVRGFYAFGSNLVGDSTISIVAGSPLNRVDPNAEAATVSGGGGMYLGQPKPNRALGRYTTVSGGLGNLAGDSTLSFGGDGATVGGGDGNRATKGFATISGGFENLIQASNGTIGGGYRNVVSGSYATIPGGRLNAARGTDSFAAGYLAKANHDGSFVWNHLVPGSDTLGTTADHQFLIRADGGVGIGTNRPRAALGVHQQFDAPGNGIRLQAYVDPDTVYWETYVDAAKDYNWRHADSLIAFIDNFDGQYYQVSDRRLKKDIAYMGSILDRVLSLRPATYRFTRNPSSSPKTSGLIAQEVEAIFPDAIRTKNGLKTMSYGQLSVYAIKAIQEQQALIEELQREVALLKGR